VIYCSSTGRGDCSHEKTVGRINGRERAFPRTYAHSCWSDAWPLAGGLTAFGLLPLPLLSCVSV